MRRSRVSIANAVGALFGANLFGKSTALRSAAFACLAPLAGAGEVARRIAELRGEHELTAERAAAELAELDPAAAPEILDLLAGRDGETGLLETRERELLLTSLRAWPPDDAVQALVSAVPATATLDARLLVLELLGEVGGRDAIRATAELCAPLSDEESAHPRLAEVVVETLARVLRRDERAYAELRNLLARGDPPPELEERAARALGDAARGQGLALLEELLGRNASLDRTVLDSLGRLRPFDAPEALTEAAHAARGFLRSNDPELRRAAALALGRLRDADAVPELIALVDDEDRRVQRGASLALSWISGLAASAPSGAWQRWHESELRWLDDVADALRLDLAAEEPARVLTALRILSSHPLIAHAVAEEIQPLLVHEETSIALAACGALVKLDDVTAFEALLDALEDEREPVRAAAAAALTSLTRVAPGPDPAAWRAWVDPTLP